MNRFHSFSRLAALLGTLATFFFSVPTTVHSAPPTLTPPHIALGSTDAPAALPGIYGPMHYGPDFGLAMTKDDFTYFSSQELAVQALLSGQADIVAVPFATNFLLRDKGQDLRVFCLRNGGSDNVLVGRNGITKIEQLLDPKTRIAIDSPGGSSDIVLNALFQVHGIKATTKDLKNTLIVESATDRQTAFATNRVDVTTISLSRVRAVQKQVSDAVIIAKSYDDMPLYLSATYSAPADWLDAHQDVATAFCASVIKAQRALVTSYDLFSQAAQEFIAKPPDDASLKETWNLVVSSDSWRLTTGLDPKSAEFMSSILTSINLIKQTPDLSTVFDLRPYQAALKLLPPFDADAALSATAEASPASTKQATMAATP